MVRSRSLRNVNLADAKAHLSKLVEWAAASNTVRITRRVLINETETGRMQAWLGEQEPSGLAISDLGSH